MAILEKKSYDDLVMMAMESLDGIEAKKLVLVTAILLDIHILWSDEHDAYLVYWPDDEDEDVEPIKVKDPGYNHTDLPGSGFDPQKES